MLMEFWLSDMSGTTLISRFAGQRVHIPVILNVQSGPS